MAKKDAIPALLEMMRDPEALPRVRLNAAVSASRVERLQLPGEAAPASVQFLQSLIDDDAIDTSIRREAAAAVAYFERRSKKNALQYQVTDIDARGREWKRILNGLLRRHLWAHGRWPRDRHVLYRSDEPLEHPPHDPELALAALLWPVDRNARRRARRTIDEPIAASITSEEQRVAILRDIARCMHARLAEFADRAAAE